MTYLDILTRKMNMTAKEYKLNHIPFSDLAKIIDERNAEARLTASADGRSNYEKAYFSHASLSIHYTNIYFEF